MTHAPKNMSSVRPKVFYRVFPAHMYRGTSMLFGFRLNFDEQNLAFFRSKDVFFSPQRESPPRVVSQRQAKKNGMSTYIFFKQATDYHVAILQYSSPILAVLKILKACFTLTFRISFCKF